MWQKVQSWWASLKGELELSSHSTSSHFQKFCLQPCPTFSAWPALTCLLLGFIFHPPSDNIWNRQKDEMCDDEIWSCCILQTVIPGSPRSPLAPLTPGPPLNTNQKQAIKTAHTQKETCFYTNIYVCNLQPIRYHFVQRNLSSILKSSNKTVHVFDMNILWMWWGLGANTDLCSKLPPWALWFIT